MSKILPMALLLSVFSLLVFPLPARAADPNSAAYSHDETKIFWIIHISDSHIGTNYYDEDTRFTWFFQEAVPTIQPLLIINSGDLVDGSLNGIPASGQDEEEWLLYRNIVDDSGVTADFYYDLPGNHDGYGDEGMSFYTAWSLSGTHYGTLTHPIPVTTSFGDYFFFGAATPGLDGSTFIEHPEWSVEELDELETQLSNHDSDDLIFVFGHHRPGQPENGDAAMDIIQQHGGFYFHGHSHNYDRYIYDQIVVGEVDSLGKATNENLGVVAVDNNAVSYAVTDSEDPWPFIVITAPSSKYLASGEENPHAYDVCNTGQENPIRALVFDVNTISAVTLETGDGTPVGLSQNATIPQLWEGTFDASGLAAGDHTLTITAAGTQVRSRDITIQLADVECPDPTQPPPPDAGVEDGGAPVDAAPTPPDASELQDAAVARDASAVPDGSTYGGSGDRDGCSCTTAGQSRSPLPPWLVWILLAFAGLAMARKKTGKKKSNF